MEIWVSDGGHGVYFMLVPMRTKKKQVGEADSCHTPPDWETDVSDG